VADDGYLHAVDFQLLQGKNGPKVTLGEPWQISQSIVIRAGRGVEVAGTFFPLLTDEQVELWITRSEEHKIAAEMEQQRSQYFGAMMMEGKHRWKPTPTTGTLLPVASHAQQEQFDLKLPARRARDTGEAAGKTAAQAMTTATSYINPDPFFRTTLTRWSSKAWEWGLNIWNNIRQLGRSGRMTTSCRC
jgi:hypothetical protein